MTALYRLDADADRIARRFYANAGADPWAGGYVAPARFAPVVTEGPEFVAGPNLARRPRRLTPRLWGVPPPPAAPDPTRGVLSVRNPESPFWIGNLRNPAFRCLVPATAFMLWGEAKGAQGRREQHWFAPGDQEFFALVGVWKDSEVPSFALLTCPASAMLRAAGHDTMPVILPPDPRACDGWLRGAWQQARTLLQPYSTALLRRIDRPREA